MKWRILSSFAFLVCAAEAEADHCIPQVNVLKSQLNAAIAELQAAGGRGNDAEICRYATVVLSKAGALNNFIQQRQDCKHVPGDIFDARRSAAAYTDVVDSQKTLCASASTTAPKTEPGRAEKLTPSDILSCAQITKQPLNRTMYTAKNTGCRAIQLAVRTTNSNGFTSCDVVYVSDTGSTIQSEATPQKIGACYTSSICTAAKAREQFCR